METASLTESDNVVIPTTIPKAPPPPSAPKPNKQPPKLTAPIPETVRPYTREEVIALIEEYSTEYGISPGTPLRIAICESGLRHEAKNKTSTASGVFQYLASTWASTPAGRQGLSVFDARANIHMAVASMATTGTAPWRASQHCWDH